MTKNTIKLVMTLLFLVLAESAVFCKTKSDGMKPVQSFDSKKYLGKWYEIARYDFAFEKNMSNCTAEYSLNKDGTIKVLNSGYDYKKNKWKQSVGKAKFVGSETEGALKVSFFGPFYSDYTVIAIDEYYQYALVAGENKKLMWILSRTPTIPEAVRQDFLKIAQNAGYDTSTLVWTEQQ